MNWRLFVNKKKASKYLKINKNWMQNLKKSPNTRAKHIQKKQVRCYQERKAEKHKKVRKTILMSETNFTSSRNI